MSKREKNVEVKKWCLSCSEKSLVAYICIHMYNFPDWRAAALETVLNSVDNRRGDDYCSAVEAEVDIRLYYFIFE